LIAEKGGNGHRVSKVESTDVLVKKGLLNAVKPEPEKGAITKNRAGGGGEIRIRGRNTQRVKRRSEGSILLAKQ